MTPSMNLRFVGILLVLLGLSHAFFNRYFGWERELAGVSLLTRQIFFVHSFFIRALKSSGISARALTRTRPHSRSKLPLRSNSPLARQSALTAMPKQDSRVPTRC